MEKSNEKDKIRNRYAKLQPLVNRNHVFQTPNPISNYHRVKPSDQHCIDSYAHQLQNDFGNFVLAKSMETKVIKKPLGTELRNFKMPLALFDQSILSPATNAEPTRKQKIHKHRNKEKLCGMSNLDLRAELLDILNCILYIMSSPVVFLARLFLTLTSSTASALYNIATWCAPQVTNTSQKEKVLKLEEKKVEIPHSFPTKCREEKQPSDSNKFFSKWSGNFNPGGCFPSQGIKNSVTIGQARTEGGKSLKELQSLRKKFNLSLEMVDEMCGNLGIKGGNYFQYSLRHQDISSVELSSDCLSNKYSSRFLDYKDCRKKTSRQYQNSVSNAGKKSSFKGSKTAVNSKQLHIHSNNSSRKKQPKVALKNLDRSDASEFSEKQIERIDPKSRSYMYNKHTDSKLESIDPDSSKAETEGELNGHKKSSATLLTGFRKKRCEKSRLHATFPPSPLRHTLHEKSSSEDERQYQKMTRKCDYTLYKDLKSNLVVPDSRNSNLQPIVDPHRQITNKSESYMNMTEDSSQKKELNNRAVVSISLSQCNAKKLVSEHDAASSNLQYKAHFGTPENETIVSESFKGISDLDGAPRRASGKKQTETSESLNQGVAEKDLSQSEKVCQGFEGKKRMNGSGDLPKLSENEKLKTAEFTKPIDAKSKWIEMKKKFYGKDYTAVKEQPEKLESGNLSRITSVSKLPAQKIFQYNMQVGRARQMGEEPPSVEDIFLQRKTTSPCLKALEHNAAGSNPRRNESQYLKSLIPTSRCLSQTQSLSQWPLDLGNSSRAKKYCSVEEKPKPKPRTEGGINRETIGGGGKTTTMSSGFVQFPERPLTGVNSSVSSLDVRDNQVLQDGPRPLDWPLQMQNPAGILSMKNANLCDDYADKIESLISFCRSPSSVPRESIDRDSRQANRTDHKFFDEAAAGDSS